MNVYILVNLVFVNINWVFLLFLLFLSEVATEVYLFFNKTIFKLVLQPEHEMLTYTVW